MAIALSGPLVGLLLFAFGLVLAPPWTFLSGLIYVPVACLALPVGLAALALGRVGLRGFLAVVLLAVVISPFYLMLLGPLPTGMTDCQPVDAPGGQAHYACVSTSSDDTSYRHEFTLQGPPGSPLLRMVETP
ncbi:MAG: hypothetical protein Kow0031_19770 [Anaerolineae bacterium]